MQIYSLGKVHCLDLSAPLKGSAWQRDLDLPEDEKREKGFTLVTLEKTFPSPHVLAELIHKMLETYYEPEMYICSEPEQPSLNSKRAHGHTQTGTGHTQKCPKLCNVDRLGIESYRVEQKR